PGILNSRRWRGQWTLRGAEVSRCVIRIGGDQYFIRHQAILPHPNIENMVSSRNPLQASRSGIRGRINSAARPDVSPCCKSADPAARIQKNTIQADMDRVIHACSSAVPCAAKPNVLGPGLAEAHVEIH